MIFNRFKDFLGCHRYDLGEICEVIYHGLNEQVVECMFDGAFRAQSLDDAWNFYEWIAKDTYKWDMKMMYIEN